MEQQRHHVLLVTYPAQGHVNPSLQFAKRLIRLGVEVTFATSLFVHRQMTKASSAPKRLNIAVFSDGYDDGFKLGNFDAQHHMSEMKNRGSDTLRDVIHSSADQGRPITRLVYTLLLPWAAEVARECHIPFALLWIQPATVLDIYYHYFHGYEDAIKNSCTDPNWTVQLPGLPFLEGRDLPSFLVPSNPGMGLVISTFKEQLDTLDEEEKPKVLVNTFDALEPEALKAFQKYDMVGIGPLVPSAFLDGKDPSDTSSGVDLFQKSEDYKEWLNSKPAASVIYVSFGSLLNLQKQQQEEIARGLLESGRPFLWVIRAKGKDEEEKEEDKLSCIEELQQKGMIVPWCSQLEVLTHPSLGCFMTHCGWNSTLESIVCGVPVIGVPQWSDQGTNAKLLQDVWKTGVRARANGDGIVESDEIKRCIELVMEDADKGLELRMNAKKLKGLARQAVQEGGSSDKNLKTFLEEVGEGF